MATPISSVAITHKHRLDEESNVKQESSKKLKITMMASNNGSSSAAASGIPSSGGAVASVIQSTHSAFATYGSLPKTASKASPNGIDHFISIVSKVQGGLILTLSYLPISDLLKWSKDLHEGPAQFGLQNRNILLCLINGYTLCDGSNKMEAITDFFKSKIHLSRCSKLSKGLKPVYSPVIYSQIRAQRALNLAVIMEYYNQGISFEYIFRIIGEKLEKLDLNELPEDPSVEVADLAAILRLVGRYCPNLKSLVLPTTGYANIDDDLQLIVKAFAVSITKWKSLSEISCHVKCAQKIFNVTTIEAREGVSKVIDVSFSKISKLTLYSCEDFPCDIKNWKSLFKKCLNLQYLELVHGNYLEISDEVLMTLAETCPRLCRISIDASDIGILVNQDKGIIAIIEKCPIISLQLQQVAFTPSIVNQLLKSTRRLEELAFDVGEMTLKSEQLNDFLEANLSIKRFSTGVAVSDGAFPQLLNFVMKNKNLEYFSVTFGNHVVEEQISLSDLENFVLKCSLIKSVEIDLDNYKSLPKGFLKAIALPNTTFKAPEYYQE